MKSFFWKSNWWLVVVIVTASFVSCSKDGSQNRSTDAGSSSGLSGEESPASVDQVCSESGLDLNDPRDPHPCRPRNQGEGAGGYIVNPADISIAREAGKAHLSGAKGSIKFIDDLAPDQRLVHFFSTTQQEINAARTVSTFPTTIAATYIQSAMVNESGAFEETIDVDDQKVIVVSVNKLVSKTSVELSILQNKDTRLLAAIAQPAQTSFSALEPAKFAAVRRTDFDVNSFEPFEWVTPGSHSDCFSDLSDFANGFTALPVVGFPMNYHGLPGTCISLERDMGKLNSHASFADDQYISLYSPKAVAQTSAEPFSLEVWMADGASVSDLITSLLPQAYAGYHLAICATSPTEGACGGVGSGRIVFELGASDVFRLRVSNARSLQNDKWHHIVVTYDGKSLASGVHFFIDGAPDGMQTLNDSFAGGPIVQVQPNFSIGDALNGNQLVNLASSGHPYTGKISVARFYSGELSPTDVHDLCKAYESKFTFYQCN